MPTLSFRDFLASNAPLVADGATGSNLQARGLLHGTPSEVWVMENPQAIVQLHRDFVEAGAQLILTSTFGATGLRLEHSGLQAQAVEVNQRAVALAKEAIGNRHVYVGGSMGPTGQLLDPLGPLQREQAVQAYAEQARALAEAGADVLVIETQFDLGEASAAIQGARAVTTLPIVCSFSFDMGTRTMMGGRPSQLAKDLTELGVDVVGLNCGKSVAENLANLQDMRANTSLPLWMKPNAGLPRMGADDHAVYDMTPAEMGAQAQQWLAAGARIIGGCCGTSPDHLRAIATAARSFKAN